MVSSTRILKVAEQLALDSVSFGPNSTKEEIHGGDNLVEVAKVLRLVELNFKSLRRRHFDLLEKMLYENSNKSGHLSLEQFKASFVDWVSQLIMHKHSIDSSFWDQFNKYSVVCSSSSKCNESSSSAMRSQLTSNLCYSQPVNADNSMNSMFEVNNQTQLMDDDELLHGCANNSAEFTRFLEQDNFSQHSGSRASVSNRLHDINMEQYKSEIVYLKQRLTSRENVISSQKESLNEMKALQEKYADAKARLKESDQQVRSFKNESINNRRQILDYETKFQSTNNELVKFVNKCDQLGTNLKECTSEKKQLSLENIKLKSEMENLRNERSILVDKADSLLKENTSLQQQCNRAASLENTMAAMNSSKNTEDICTEYEHSMLMTTLNQMEKLKENSVARDKEYEERLNKIKAIAKEINQMNIELGETINDLKCKMDSMKCVIEKLQHDKNQALKTSVKNQLDCIITKACKMSNEHNSARKIAQQRPKPLGMCVNEEICRLLKIVLIPALFLLFLSKLIFNYYETGAIFGSIDGDLIDYLFLEYFGGI